ncbi:MAG TPA: hypothetical protein VGK25_11590 [Ignavibacteria bacterium]
MKKIINILFRFVDILLLPIVYLLSCFLYIVRTWGIQRFRLCNRALFKMGILPTRDYYYKPVETIKDTKQINR